MLMIIYWRITSMTNILIDNTKSDYWNLTREELDKLIRLAYLETFIKPVPSYCPECNSELTTTEDEDETICTYCGLITSASSEYVAGNKINLPYGRH